MSDSDLFGRFEQTEVDGWIVRRYGEIASTQDIAAALPCWTAVVAESQTGGRGQWQRRFTSDRGGLYLTAVLPFDADAAQWRGFALAVGWAVISGFRARMAASLRLRWPNDLMIGDKKLGGILVSQGRPDSVCVGLGLNVRNRPWLEDRGLEATACRLADHAPEEQLGFDRLLQALLGAIRSAHRIFFPRGLSGLVEALNQSWGGPREVRLEMAPGATVAEIGGRFQGILPNGDLLLEDSAGRRLVVGFHLVKRLRED